MTSSKEYELYPNQFYCPKCFARRPNRVKPISVKISFYFILLFDNRDLEFVTECQACKKGFDPRILKPHSQNLVRLAVAARGEIRHGLSVENLKEELASAGLNREVADRLINLALI